MYLICCQMSIHIGNGTRVWYFVVFGTQCVRHMVFSYECIHCERCWLFSCRQLDSKETYLADILTGCSSPPQDEEDWSYVLCFEFMFYVLHVMFWVMFCHHVGFLFASLCFSVSVHMCSVPAWILVIRLCVLCVIMHEEGLMWLYCEVIELLLMRIAGNIGGH